MWIGALGVVAGIAVAEARAAAQDLLVSSANNHTVLRYDGVTGEPRGVFVPPGSGGLERAQGLAYGPDGNLYVGSATAGTGPGTIKRYHGRTGAFIDTFASGGGLTGPWELMFRPDGNLYVGSYGDRRILRYNGTTGQYMGVFIPAADGDLGGFIFAPGDCLYVGNGRPVNNVLRYDAATGAPTGEVIPPGHGLDGPSFMAFGPDGNLYIAGWYSYNVLRYDPYGRFIDAFVPSSPRTLVNPMGGVFGPDGNLYVADYGGGRVQRYNGMTGEHMGVFVSVNTPFWLVFMPHPADFDADNDVDLKDLERFLACVTGPAIPYNPDALPPGCLMPSDANGRIAADFDKDGDVDQSDFGIFQRCFSGPGKAADPQCTN